MEARADLSRIETALEKERAKSRDAVQALDESMQREHTLRASMKTLEAERDAKLELKSDALSIARSELVSLCLCGSVCVCAYITRHYVAYTGGCSRTCSSDGVKT